MLKLLLPLLLLALTNCTTAEVQAVPTAAVEREAAYRLENCIRAKYRDKADCVEASRSFCTESGVEPDCGVDIVWSELDLFSPR